MELEGTPGTIVSRTMRFPFSIKLLKVKLLAGEQKATE